MKYWQNAFELYINSSIHVSLAIVAFSLISFFEYELPLNQDLLFFIFFASVTGYNFVKYAGIAKLHHLSLAKNLRIIQVFSAICFIALVYFSFQLDLNTLAATALLGLFTLFYALPVFGDNRNLRSLPGIKIFIIASVWAGSTVLLPVIDSAEGLQPVHVVDFLQRLVLVLVLTLPFEIRDLHYDDAVLDTIPQKLGSYRTKLLGSVLLFFILLTELLQTRFATAEFISFSAALIITGMLLWYSKKQQPKYYSSFWVELVPVLYLGVYLVMKFFLQQTPF